MTLPQIILTNSKDKSLKKVLTDFAESADSIKIATAFFSDTKFISAWLNDSKKVDLLISLRPPTNYYSLKDVHLKSGINIQFLGHEFHSKFLIFYSNEKPFACIVGSSNLTEGGLQKNIETNAILTNLTLVEELEEQFSILWRQSYLLRSVDLLRFKEVFIKFQNRNQQAQKEQSEFEKKIFNRRAVKSEIKLAKEVKQYRVFREIIDEIKEMVIDISKAEYPNIPVNLTIDHFWHWIKKIWSKENRQKPTALNRSRLIPKLFKEYCKWDKSAENYTQEMARRSKALFANILSERNIDSLSKDQAKKIYANLHSGGMKATRFHSDEVFATENSIEKIRSSLKYLLYSKNEIELRIHNLCLNPDFKLHQFKFSGAQELIGWVMPEKYPIRNYKADFALKQLGYNLD